MQNIKVRPKIKAISDHCVSFKDGSSSPYDSIVTAIGYETHLPMMNRKDAYLEWQDDLPILYLNLIAPRAKGLFFAGFAQARAGGGPLFEGYGELIARMAALELNSVESIFERLQKLKRMKIVPKLYRIKPISRLDMRSRGLGELKKGIWLLSSALNRLERTD